MSERPSLFRQEATEHQRQRHWGQAMRLALPGATALFYAIMLVSALIVIFLLRVQYARKETVTGYLAPSLGVVRVFAARPGTISAIHVREGQAVAEGQPLLTVSVDQTASGGTNVDTSVLEALASQRSLLNDRIETQQRLEAAERARLTAQIAGLEAEMAQIALQIAAQGERTRLSATRASAGAELSTRGVLSEADANLRREAYLEQRRGLAALTQELVSRRNDHAALRLALEQLPTATTDKVQSLRKDILDIEQRIAEIDGRRGYVVRAPVAGHVSALQAIEGRSADPRLPQLSILPQDGILQAELFLPARAAGFVRPGQEVRILYEAFPYQRFGAYRGQVAQVSQTMLMPADIATPVALREPGYRVLASLERQEVVSSGRSTPLRADMLLRADIVLDRRPLMAWLIDPLLRVRLS